jgi:hypothetical protein
MSFLSFFTLFFYFCENQFLYQAVGHVVVEYEGLHSVSKTPVVIGFFADGIDVGNPVDATEQPERPFDSVTVQDVFNALFLPIPQSEFSSY